MANESITAIMMLPMLKLSIHAGIGVTT
jgi:hypothetical protein